MHPAPRRQQQVAARRALDAVEIQIQSVEATKQSLCDELHLLVSESAAAQLAKMEELRATLEALRSGVAPPPPPAAAAAAGSTAGPYPAQPALAPASGALQLQAVLPASVAPPQQHQTRPATDGVVPAAAARGEPAGAAAATAGSHALPAAPAAVASATAAAAAAQQQRASEEASTARSRHVALPVLHSSGAGANVDGGPPRQRRQHQQQRVEQQQSQQPRAVVGRDSRFEGFAEM